MNGVIQDARIAMSSKVANTRVEVSYDSHSDTSASDNESDTDESKYTKVVYKIYLA